MKLIIIDERDKFMEIYYFKISLCDKKIFNKLVYIRIIKFLIKNKDALIKNINILEQEEINNVKLILSDNRNDIINSFEF